MKFLKRHKALFLLVIFFSLNAFSQEYQLKGNVTDSKKEPLIGVNIVNANNPKQSVQTDEYGDFVMSFTEKGDYKINFSYIGFKSTNAGVTIGEQTAKVNIVLQELDNNLNEVIIVSNRDRESRSDVPQSVSILSGKEIAKIEQYSTAMTDIVARIPGVALSSNRQSNRGQKIRGGNMLVLIDGIPQSTPLFIDDNLNYLDASAVERIEVIKGSTSIYGNGAQGGIINFITKKGNSTKKLESQTKLGTSSSLVEPNHTAGINLGQFFSGQLGKVNYNVGGSYKQFGITRGAQGEILSPKDGMGESEWYNLFSKIRYDLGNESNLEVMYNYFSNQQQSELTHVPGVYGKETATGVFGESDPNLQGQGVKYNHNLRLSFDKNEIFANTAFTATYYWQKYATLYASFDYFTDVSNGYVGGQNYTKSDQMGIRTNFNTKYELAENLSGNLIYGLDILSNKTAQPMADGRQYTPEMNMKNYAAYLQIKTKWNDFVFKGGTRLEHIDIKVDDYTTIYRDNGTVTGGGLDINGGKLSFNALTFNAALRYNKLHYFQPYVSFSQSFSVGELGKVLRIATDPNIITDKLQDTKAVITDSYEIGIEGKISRNIHYGANYFIYKQKLGTTYVMNPQTNFFELSRLPEKINGAEFELDVKVNDKLDFDLSLSLLQGKTDNNGNGKFNDKEDKDMDGSRISAPILRGGVNYDVTPKWNLNVTGTFVGDRDKFAPTANGTYLYAQGPVKSYFVANMFTSYQLSDSTSLSAGIENLFNNDYYPAFSQWYGNNDFYIKGNGINAKVAVTIKL